MFPYRLDVFLKLIKMSETIDEKIKNYRTAPFDSRFPNTNQTRNCYQNYLGKGMDLGDFILW